MISGYLQSAASSLSYLQTGDQELNIWFVIEFLLITGVILYQLYISRTVYKKIHQLKEIFDYGLIVKSGYITKENLNDSDNAINKIKFINNDEKTLSANPFSDKPFVKISITESYGSNGVILRIKDAINTYLLSNYGAAVNFSIIKDIIDREVDVKDEEISQDLPTPLYFGLAATMIGIICGLFSMPGLNGDKFSLGINSLVNGVKLAMFASLTGLLCTTYLSSFFYKKAKRKILSDKNEQISYLQAKLLPELIRAEDTGVTGLKASLDRFAKVATEISDNVLIAAKKTGENIILQQETIAKVEKLDMLRISKTNLELFNRLESNMHVFNRFSEYLLSMSQISENLKEFALRTANIDRVVEQINSVLLENKRLSEFLTSHFEKIETVGNSALKAVDLTDVHFKDAIEKLKDKTDISLNQVFNAVDSSTSHFSVSIEKLKEEVDNRISQLNTAAGNNEVKLTEIYNNIGNKLALITSQHISQFQAAYSNAIPQFNQLSNLEALPKIQEQVSLSISQLQNDSNINSGKLIETVVQLNHTLNNFRDNLNNHAILTRLESIEQQLKKGKSVSNSPDIHENAKTVKPEVSFFKRLRNRVLFARRRW
jgi:hypothetical protein